MSFLLIAEKGGQEGEALQERRFYDEFKTMMRTRISMKTKLRMTKMMTKDGGQNRGLLQKITVKASRISLFFFLPNVLLVFLFFFCCYCSCSVF